MEPVRLWRGYYSNVCRGRQQKEDQHRLIPYVIEPQEDSKEYRKNWARLIRKMGAIDRLLLLGDDIFYHPLYETGLHKKSE